MWRQTLRMVRGAVAIGLLFGANALIGGLLLMERAKQAK